MPKREGRNDSDWTADDFTASHNLKRLWLRITPTLHLSQNQLAKRWDCTQSAVSRYINGKLCLNPETVLKFAVVLDVPPETIDPRITQLMRHKKHEYLHSIVVKTNEYEPRVFQGDWVSLDVVNKPKEGRLVAAHNTQDLLIGIYRQGVLFHPTTNVPQVIPPNYIVHNVTGIIPKENTP